MAIKAEAITPNRAAAKVSPDSRVQAAAPTRSVQAEDAALLPALTYSDKAEAESAWHQKMSAAAISKVDIHTVLLVDEHGNNVAPGRPWYEHLTEVEQ